MSEIDESRGACQPVETGEQDPIVPAQARREIESALSAFRQWLLDSEQWREVAAWPVGAQEEESVPGVDLHTMVREWIALRQEVRLESRVGKTSREQMDQAVGAFHEGLEQAHQQLRESLEPTLRERDRMREEFQAQLESKQRHWVELLLDVRDALARGAQCARRPLRSSWWRRWFGRREPVEGQLEGYELALRRIDAALGSQGVRPINCQGQPVDPQLMHVVDVVQRDDLPEGTVIDVVRQGYVSDGRVIRFAEVRAVSQVEQ